jgi:hypothetical protein
MMLGRDDSGDVRLERTLLNSGDYLNGDRVFTPNATSISTTTNTITIAGGSGWTPAAGDLWTSNNGAQSIVRSSANSTHFVVDDASIHDTGVGEALESFSSQLVWQPDTGGSSTVWKRYVEMVTHWDDTFGRGAWAITGTPSTNAQTTASYSYTATLDRENHNRADTRSLWDRTVALTQHMSAGVTVRCADARWRITGIALGAERASSRASR